MSKDRSPGEIMPQEMILWPAGRVVGSVDRIGALP